MSAAKRTAGHWCVHSGARGLEIHAADDEHGARPLADVLTGEPDARTMAAAPAMADALAGLLDQLESLAGDFYICAEILESENGQAAIAALAAAGGAQ